MSDRYFKLNDDVGVEPGTGELQPMVEVGLPIAVPTIDEASGELVEVAHKVTLKPIPGTRVVKVDQPAIANGLLASGQYTEIDPPNEAALKALRGEVGKRDKPEPKTAAQLEEEARNRGIFDQIQGSGRNGTVLKRDIEAALKADDARHVAGTNSESEE